MKRQIAVKVTVDVAQVISAAAKLVLALGFVVGYL
jgi:hypothetical protein